MSDKFDQALIDAYFSHIITDYNFMSRDQEMQDSFRNGLTIEYGKKYAKVIQDGSAHSFVQLVDDAKFKRGDVLKANSWKAPAKNFSRGNILTGDFGRISWTGA